MGKQAKLKHPLIAYLPSSTVDNEYMTPAEQRKEYERLRRVARKNLKEIGESEYADTDAYEWAKTRFKPLSKISTDAEFRALLSELARWSQGNRSTLEGLRESDEKRLAALRKRDTLILRDKRELELFGEYMDSIRAANLDTIYGSDIAITYYIYKQDRYETDTATARGFAQYATRRRAERAKDPTTVKKPKNIRRTRGE